MTVLLPVVAGLSGVVIGAWLTGRREASSRRLAYIEKQLKEFYSPMLGLRNEILMRSDLRVRIHDTANTVWRSLCADAREVSIDALGKLSRTRSSEFGKITEYDNEQLRTDLLPAFKQMAKLFRDNYWLADPDTTKYYKSLVEFVELWDRWLAKAIPPEVMTELQRDEQNLEPYYIHLQSKHEALRAAIQRGGE